MKHLLQYWIPGLLLIGLAFYAGSHRNVVIGMFGFLAFFVIGVTLIVEGNKRKSKPKKD